jgi:glutamine cyclotransferase
MSLCTISGFRVRDRSIGLVISIFIIFLIALFGTSIILFQLDNDSVSIYSYSIVNSFPHDPSAFTQGLVYDNGFLYEGTGLLGQSSVRKVNLETGDILKIHHLPPRYFGEGITIFRDKLFQVTWKSNIGFVYNKYSLELLNSFEIQTEGWGLTNDGKNLIMSDGTSTIRFLDFDTFEEIKKIEIMDQNETVTKINELEYVNGEIYANIWETGFIAIIDPRKGKVVGWIDLSDLLNSLSYEKNINVLNGIAYDKVKDRLFVTGKLWPTIFEIRLIHDK